MADETQPEETTAALKQARLQALVDDLAGRLRIKRSIKAFVLENVSGQATIIRAKDAKRYCFWEKTEIPALHPRAGLIMLASDDIPEDTWPSMAAHELGHVANGDIFRIWLLRLIRIALAFVFIGLVITVLIPRARDTFHSGNLLGMLALVFLLFVLQDLYLRHREMRADRRACELLGGETYAEALVRAAGPTPPFSARLLGSHPPIDKRIAQAMRYTARHPK